MGKKSDNPNHKCGGCPATIKASHRHTLSIACLGDEHFVDLKHKVCKECLGLGKSTYRRRRYDWIDRQSKRFSEGSD